MQLKIHQHFWKKGIFFLLFLTALKISPAVNQVPAPKNLAEAKKMMRITLDHHILPSGANQEILEKMLALGEVLLFFDHSGEIPWMSAAGVLIQAPPEQVYSVILDHPHYPEFVPMTEKISSKQLFDEVYQDELHLKVKLAFINYRMVYSLYSYHQPPYRLDWSLAWGEFDRCLGFWELVPSTDQKSTLAFYSIYSEPRSKFLKMIYNREPTLEMMTNVSTATMIVQAIKAESEKRQGIKPSAPQPASWKEIEKILTEDVDTLGKFLTRGKLLILKPDSTIYLIAGALVNKPIQDAYGIIVDFKKYPEFMPGVKGVEYLGPGKLGEVYQWEMEFDLAGFKFTQIAQWQYQFFSPYLVSWEIPRACCPPADGFWKLIPLRDKTIIFNGTTADIRSLGRIPRYALSVEPTLEYASFASQGILVLNALKTRIEKK